MNALSAQALKARLARDILEVPEAVLARAECGVSVELAIACQMAGYLEGEQFLQWLQKRAAAPADARLQRRAALLVGYLRAMVESDARPAHAPDDFVIDAGKILKRRGPGYQAAAGEPEALRRARAG